MPSADSVGERVDMCGHQCYSVGEQVEVGRTIEHTQHHTRDLATHTTTIGLKTPHCTQATGPYLHDQGVELGLSAAVRGSDDEDLALQRGALALDDLPLALGFELLFALLLGPRAGGELIL